MIYLGFGAIGILFGLAFYFLAIHHVKVRCDFEYGGNPDNEIKLELLRKKYFIPVWMLSYMMIFMIVALVWVDPGRWDAGQDRLEVWRMLRVLVFASFAFDVSAIDILIRRIPNSMLLGMILLQTVDIVMNIALQPDIDPIATILKSVVGMVAAFVVFGIPAMLNLSTGMGDVKYSATIGFLLGFYNYVEAMLLMALSLFMYLVYLTVTKTGNLKTKTPMGPFLSIGAFIAFLLPMWN